MFTSGLIESEYEGRWVRGAAGSVAQGKNKQRQRLVLQGIKQKTLEVSLYLSLAYSGVCNCNPFELTKHFHLIQTHFRP